MESEVGARIRALRSARKPTMTLAELAGGSLSVALVSKLERGLVNPSLATLVHLASRLGVPVASLFDDSAGVNRASARGSLDASRARLLLGDPAGAGGEASAAAFPSARGVEASVEDRVIRARLFAVAADAWLQASQTADAARALMEGSALLTGAGTSMQSSEKEMLAQAELTWVLGMLERRRGAFREAERTWTRCLALLEGAMDAHPWWQLLRASVLGELGTLAEARGDPDVARNLVARAASSAAGVAQAVSPAQALLASWAECAPAGTAPELLHAGPAAALALAITVAADRLVRRLTQEAVRLERSTATPTARLPMPDVPKGRHLV